MTVLRRMLLIVSVTLLSRVAHAQSGAEAEILFKRGIELLDAGKYPEACQAFDASQRLEPALSTLLNQANCRELNKQLATAWGLFLEVARQTRNATEEQSKQFHEVAVDRAAKLEPRLSKLTIRVPANARLPGLEVRRAAAPIEIGGWDQPLPIDGGVAEVVVSAPGHEKWTTTITVKPEGDNQAIDVPVLDKTPPRLVAKRSKWPFVIGGAGLALGAVAVALDLSAQSTYDRSTKEPDDAQQASLHRAANHKRYAAEGLAVAGLACVGVAVWMYLRPKHEVAQTSVSVVPKFAPGEAGLQLVGGF